MKGKIALAFFHKISTTLSWDVAHKYDRHEVYGYELNPAVGRRRESIFDLSAEM
jgi:hypothetical protein